jgi:hypothetical protein
MIRAKIPSIKIPFLSNIPSPRWPLTSSLIHAILVEDNEPVLRNEIFIMASEDI